MKTTKSTAKTAKKRAKKASAEHVDLLGDVRRSAARGPLDTSSPKAHQTPRPRRTAAEVARIAFDIQARKRLQEAGATAATNVRRAPPIYVDTDSAVLDHARLAELMANSIYGKFGHNPTKALLGQLDALRQEGGAVVHPKHYNSHPSGVECIAIVEHMTFNTGSAVKYCWRAGLKVEEGTALTVDAADAEALARIKDLEKARWFLSREIEKLTKEQTERVKKRLNRGFGVVGSALDAMDPPSTADVAHVSPDTIAKARAASAITRSKKKAPAKKKARATGARRG